MSRFNTLSPRELGRVMESLTSQIRDAEKKQFVIWEKTLRLHVNEKPRFMPRPVWAWIVGLVLTQSGEEKVLPGAIPMPEEVLHADGKAE